MRHRASILAAIAVMALATVAGAQTNPSPPAGRQRLDPAAMRAQMVDRIKTGLGCSDDEWKVIEPKLVKVLILKIDVGEFGVPGGNPFAARINTFIRNLLDPNALPSEVDDRMADLQNLISENATSTESYKNTLGQLRRAREKARAALNAAEKDLTGDLTLREEAELVQMGLIE